MLRFLRNETAKLQKEHAELTRVIDQQRDELRDAEASVRKARVEVAELKQTHKMEVESIEHMTRMLEEKSALDVERKLMESARVHASDLEDVRADYQEKLTERLEGEIERIRSMYSEIMARLPSVTAHVGDAAPKTKRR